MNKETTGFGLAWLILGAYHFYISSYTECSTSRVKIQSYIKDQPIYRAEVQEIV